MGSTKQVLVYSYQTADPSIEGRLALTAVPVIHTYMIRLEYGEAPENFLAVENLATGANKPGWVMQSDLLSPLAP